MNWNESIIRGLKATIAGIDRTLAEPLPTNKRRQLEARRRDIARKLAQLEQKERAA